MKQNSYIARSTFDLDMNLILKIIHLISSNGVQPYVIIDICFLSYRSHSQLQLVTFACCLHEHPTFKGVRISQENVDFSVPLQADGGDATMLQLCQHSAHRCFRIRPNRKCHYR